MKTDAITKINKIGRIGNILTIVARVLAFLLLIIGIVGTIFLATVPEDFATLKLNMDALVDVDLSALNVQLSEDEQKELQSSLQEGSMTIRTGSVSSELETNSAMVDKDGFALRTKGETANLSLRKVALPLLAACVYIAMTIVTLFFIGSLCKAFSTCQSPFEDNVITKMKHLAFSLIPWVILSSITNGLSDGFLTGSYDFNASINLDTLLVILLIFVLTYIFQYGAMLQQESDETL